MKRLITIFCFVFFASASFAQSKVTASSDSTCPPIPYFHLSAKPPLFSVSTDISFELPSAGIINVQIFNYLGKLVRTIAHESLDSGWHHYTWDGKSDNHTLLASGYYTCIASGFGKSDFAKIDLIR
jgi:hypothetical protein